MLDLKIGSYITTVSGKRLRVFKKCNITVECYQGNVKYLCKKIDGCWYIISETDFIN